MSEAQGDPGTGHPVTLAFGVEPARGRYYLRLARYQALAEEIAAHVRTSPPPSGEKWRLLDVGVGRGRTMRYLDAQGVSGAIDYFGVDKSEHRLGELIYQPQRWRLTRADVEEALPYETASFDLVVAEQILEHLERPGLVVSEIARVLRPGGLFVGGVPTFPPGLSHIRRGSVALLRALFKLHPEHVQTFAAGDFVSLVTAGGCFQLRELRGFRIFSGGPLRLLERYEGWYRWNRRLGRQVPSLCVEVQGIFIRTDAATAHG